MQTEPDFINVEEEEQEISYRKPKKQLSEAQLQHLAVIREKALQKKKEMKVITEKANKIKEFETLKVAKQLQKQEMAKQYDEMINNQAKQAEPPKVEAPKPEIKEEIKQKEEIKPKEEIKKEVVKPEKKKKVIKKVIYQEASSSDSDGADEVEIVKVKKSHKQTAPKQKEVEEPPPKIKENSYTNLLYESSLDKMRTKMMDERAKYLVNSLLPQYN
jgi:hypothetical protein